MSHSNNEVILVRRDKTKMKHGLYWTGSDWTCVYSLAKVFGPGTAHNARIVILREQDPDFTIAMMPASILGVFRALDEMMVI